MSINPSNRLFAITASATVSTVILLYFGAKYYFKWKESNKTNTSPNSTEILTAADIKNNQISTLTTFRNNYYIIRHGESTANIQRIIASEPTDCINNHGLSDLGKQQVNDSIHSFHSNLGSKPVIIYSSDYKRAFETAEIVRKTLRIRDEVKIATELRERNFGIFNGKSTDNYDKVWELDAKNPSHTNNKVESVLSVLNRTTGLIKKLESIHSNNAIFLAAHGDVLQILQTAFEQISPAKHRSIKHLNNAEIRQLILKSNISTSTVPSAIDS